MRCVAVMSALLLVVGRAWGASPSGVPDGPVATFRVETAEVHVAFSGFDKHNRPLMELSPADFTLLRDGVPVNEPVSLERRHESPILATVMTDVSDSMVKAVPMARDSWQWLNSIALRADDQITYFDFGADLAPSNSNQQSAKHLTSFYDCLWKLIPQISNESKGRRAIILFTDGRDNDSMHYLQDVIKLAVERDIAVYAITTWKFKISYDDKVLDELTSSTGGRYFVVKDTKEMISTLQQITQELRNGYELVFRAGNARSGLHSITMLPNDRRAHFYHRAGYFQQNASGLQTLLVAAGR